MLVFNILINVLQDIKEVSLEKIAIRFTNTQINKGHGRIEKRQVSICTPVDEIRFWPGLKTLIRVESLRQIIRHNLIEVETETRYYISSLSATAIEFSPRIRGYWGVENKVHYVRDPCNLVPQRL